jgi:hypothetical protein
VKPGHGEGVVAARDTGVFAVTFRTWFVRTLATVMAVMFFALAPASGQELRGQEVPAAARKGVVQDWSAGTVVFTREGLLRHPALLDREARVLNQARQRFLSADANSVRGSDTTELEAEAMSVNKPAPHRDWNINPLGGRLDANMYPAKFSFDPGAPPSCTNDFVVFGLAIAGTTGGHANLVGVNNLYSGTSPAGLCGAAPTILFAYNITTAATGKIVTSPILSEDGTKIAFVESLGTSAKFHVLTWTAGQGTLTAAAAPTMTSLTFVTTANSTSSSPWIDYGADTVYLGSDNGVMHKITGVFKGTPTLAGAPWPVTVSTNFHLTPPVLDSQLGALMMGSTNGSLYKINTATGALTAVAIGSGTTNGIVAPPVVDVTNGTTFVVSANDGTSGVLVEVDTATLTQLAKGRIGEASHSGTAIHLYQPAFSNAYFTNPANGTVRLCGTGTADTTPWQYGFGFTGRTMKTTATFSQQLLTSTAARCTGWTEFFNPNIGAGGTDYFFFGLTQDCTATGAAGGCVAETTGNTAPVKTTVNGGPSGIVVDNYSTAAQASSIYLTAEKINTAYKFTQNGLQ